MHHPVGSRILASYSRTGCTDDPRRRTGERRGKSRGGGGCRFGAPVLGSAATGLSTTSGAKPVITVPKGKRGKEPVLGRNRSHTSGASGWAGLNEGETRPEGGWDKLRENTTAAKAPISLVRMPQHQLGSGKAIEHW